ncbi:MAG: carbohydrate ABC transporter permease [Chloroflexota bacterium]|nr:carbohydrate ABC transporter permease [Chloroflexota bacterium]
MGVEATSSQPPADRGARGLLRSREQQITILYLLIAVTIVLILEVPLIYMTVSSFKPGVEVYRVPPTFFPTEWVLNGYQELLELSNMVIALRNSTMVATLASTLGVTLSVGFCYTITRFRMPGMRFFTILMLFVYVLPGILLMIPMVRIWGKLGLTGGLLPLALTYVSFTLPFSIWMLRSHFAGIPLELEEAALVDGANRAQSFIKIILPLARPGIIATFIFTFILSWNEVLFATIFASSQKNVVVSTTLSNLLNERSGWHSWGMINAAGVVATLPVLVFFMLIQRQLVAGFTEGAIKG